MIWELGRTAYGQLVRFILSIVLARLLTPADFGIISISYVLIRIAQVFSDVGFSSALIQDSKVSQTSYASVFWLNVGMGVIFLVGIEVGAPFIAAFYGEETITPIIRTLGFIFIIDALCQVQSTRLKKNMDFKVINKIIIISETVSGVVAVVCAFSGFGLWSLVVQAIVSSTLNMIFYWAWSDWRPTWSFDTSEARRLFSFGGFVFINQLIYRISTRVDVLIIGKFFSTTVLGLYNRADSLLALIKKYSSSSLIKVVFPYFSMLKADPVAFRRSYDKIIGFLYFVLFLMSGICFLNGREIIVVIYGAQWEKAGEYFSIISLAIFIYPVNSVMNNALISLGLPKLSLKVGVVAVLLRLGSLTAAVLVFGDFLFVLYGLVIISVVINGIYFIALRSHVPWKEQLMLFLKFFVVSSVLTAIMFQFKAIGLVSGNIPQIIVTSGLFTFIYLGVMYLVDRQRVMTYVNLIRDEVFRRKKKVGPVTPMADD